MKSLRTVFLAGALAALASPLAALAQMAPPPPNGPHGPPPEMRAQFEAARTQARTAAMNALSADHRGKVQAILAQVQAGSLDPRSAATQIDGILSPSESAAVLAQMQTMHESLRKAMQNAPAPHPMMRHKPDAGHALMMLNMPAHPPQ